MKPRLIGVAISAASLASLLCVSGQVQAASPELHNGGLANGQRLLSLPNMPTAAKARTEQAKLKDAPYMDDGTYQRPNFGGWAKVGDCNTRELVLKRDKYKGVFSKCTVVNGSWISPYDGLVLGKPSLLDIDHLVPLKDAWFSGARKWSDDKRKQFANDRKNPQLLAVSAQSNRSKGDKAPEEWMPSRKAYHCTYVKAWTHVKSVYKLTVTKEEKAKLAAELKAPCK